MQYNLDEIISISNCYYSLSIFTNLATITLGPLCPSNIYLRIVTHYCFSKKVVIEHGRAYSLQLLHTKSFGMVETREVPLAIMMTSKFGNNRFWFLSQVDMKNGTFVTNSNFIDI